LHTIRPFGEHEMTTDPAETARRRRWNVQLSRSREAIEHAFGRLKGRFPCLRTGLPGYRLDSIYKQVEALIVLHNILEELNDDPGTIEGFNGEEDDVLSVRLAELEVRDEVGDDYSADDMFRMGVLRRKTLMEYWERQVKI
jgi:hypothetical protein